MASFGPATLGASLFRRAPQPRLDMKAIVQKGYGSPDSLELCEIDRPDRTDDTVLVRVRASSINASDWQSPALAHVSRGFSASPLPHPRHRHAGTVEACAERLAIQASGTKCSDLPARPTPSMRRLANPPCSSSHGR